MGVKLAKMEALQRDNLLLNADYRYGIVNQKGQTSYSMSGYGIDMWRSVSANGKVIVNSGSITLTTSNQYSAQFMQPVYYNLLNKTVTIAVSVKSISGTVLLNLLGINKTLQKGLNVFTYNITQNVQIGAGFQYFYFAMGSGNSIEYEFMKLEEGSVFTGMPMWNESEELLKCQARFYALRNYRCALRGHVGQIYALTVPLPVPMVKKPTAIIKDENNYNVTNTHTWVDTKVVQIGWTCTNDNMFNVNIKRLEIDGYDY